MKWRPALCGLVSVACFSQACGGSPDADSGQTAAGSSSGPQGGTSIAGSNAGLSGSAGAAAHAGSGGVAGSAAAGSGGSASGVAGGSAAAGTAAGGSAGAGVAGGGAGGVAAGGSAQGGSAPGGAATGGAGSGGAAQGGSGGVNNDGPCAVPSYISSDPKPLGWASQSSGTTGGGSTTPILVTTLAQFKTEVAGSAAKVIYVQGDFAPDNISFGSNKTIIGCSAGARLQGHLGIGSGSSNVIIRNVKVSGYGVGDCSKDPSFDAGEGCSSGADAISVNGSAHHVWIDHCSIMDGTDGNLDITNDADFVTVSYTKFSYTPRTDNVGNDSTGTAGHRFSNLVGGTDTAPTNWPSTRPLNVTWHHNWWADGVVERQPRVRYGRNHLYNNYYNSSASNYCVRAGIEASILLEGNYFDGVDSPHQFNNSSDQKTAYITLGMSDRVNSYVSTSGDKATAGGGSAFTPPYTYSVEAASSVPSTVKAGAGPH
jgi:pectate lyase